MKPIVVPMPGSEALASRLCAGLKARLGALESRRFPDGEIYLRLKSIVRKHPVIIAANLDRPDEKFLALEFLARLARDIGARQVGLVAPYLPYMRQDKRFHSGEAVTSDYFSALISHTFDWLITVDPHLHRRKKLSEIYSMPAEAAHAAPLIAAWIRDHVRAPLVVGPDSESSQWVQAVAHEAGATYSVLSKRRYGDRSVKVSSFHTSDKTNTPVIIDDILSTGRTMIETVKNVRAQGGKAPYCIAVHGIFSGDAFRALKAAGARAVITCNTVPHASNQIDVTPLLVGAARRFIEARHRRTVHPAEDGASPRHC